MEQSIRQRARKRVYAFLVSITGTWLKLKRLIFRSLGFSGLPSVSMNGMKTEVINGTALAGFFP